MPVKSEEMKTLENLFKRVNFALPEEHWKPELERIRETIDKVLQEGIKNEGSNVATVG